MFAVGGRGGGHGRHKKSGRGNKGRGGKQRWGTDNLNPESSSSTTEQTPVGASDNGWHQTAKPNATMSSQLAEEPSSSGNQTYGVHDISEARPSTATTDDSNPLPSAPRSSKAQKAYSRAQARRDRPSPQRTTTGTWDGADPETDDSVRAKALRESLPTYSDSETDAYGHPRYKTPTQLAVAAARTEVEAFLTNCPRTVGRFRNCSVFLQRRTLTHLAQHKRRAEMKAGEKREWNATLRQLLWRAVIRAGHFWVNPETGVAVGKIDPVKVPDAMFVGRFDVFVICAAERADRVGRDLPSAEWVGKVEAEVREFLHRAEGCGDEGAAALEKLAFYMMWEEELRREVGLAEVQEMIRRAFRGVKRMAWGGLTVVTKGLEKKAERNVPTAADMYAAETLWEEFGAWIEANKVTKGVAV